MVEPLSIKLNKYTNKNKIKDKITKYIVSNIENDKIDETKDYFFKSINEITQSSNDVLNQGGNITFERNIKFNNLEIVVTAEFKKMKIYLIKL